MVTSHANTKLPYQGMGVGDKQLYTETLTKTVQELFLLLLCIFLSFVAI